MPRTASRTRSSGHAAGHSPLPAPALPAIAALAAGLAVAIGAMGAHGFREAGDLRGAELLTTASHYLMWHALAVLALARLPARLQAASIVLLASAVLFATTLVLLAVGAPSWLGMLTPLGGTGLIVGWALAAWTLLRNGRQG